MPAPAVLVLAEAFLADAVVMKNAKRLEQRSLFAVVLPEAAHALPGGFFGQQLIVLTTRGHAALVGLAGYKHFRSSVSVSFAAVAGGGPLSLLSWRSGFSIFRR